MRRDDRAIYTDPGLSDQQVGTFNGGWGYYVTEVDGCKVDGSDVRLATFGGNKVKVTPGGHEFIVDLAMSNQPPGENGTGATIGVNNRQEWRFTYMVVAGHHYAIAPTSLFNTDPLITDKEDKRTEPVQYSAEAMQSPEQQKRDAVKYPGD